MAQTKYQLLLSGAINTAQTDTNIQNYIKMWQARVAGDPKAQLKLKIAVDPTSGNQFIAASGKYINSVGNMATETKSFYIESGKASVELKTLGTETQKTTGINKGFEYQMGRTVTRMAEYALSAGLIYAVLNQLRQGMQYVIDLNKQLTDIRLVSGASIEEVEQLAMGYNKLAREMGSTTKEIAAGSLEFIRQGKSAEETAILIRASTMMAKLGNMEAADATEKLTSMMNGFRMEAEDTTKIVDKLVALDNSFATSVDKIATGMRYASNVAQQVGVDFDHLAAYITVVSDVTQGSSETIGQAMRTIFSRMSAVKNLKAFDETGEDVSKVEASLRRVGINLRDDNLKFRDMQDVLDEIGKKWNTINKEDQLYIAEQIAGKQKWAGTHSDMRVN